MKNCFFFLVAIISTIQTAQAQEPNETLKQVYQDGEFFFAREDYIDALIEFNKLYKRGYNNANINYRIGVCYLNIPGEKHKAIPYLEEAARNVSSNYTEGSIKEKTAPFEAFLYLGNAYRINNQLDKAIDAYNLYKESHEDSPVNIAFANTQLEASKRAKQLMGAPVNLKWNLLGDNINSSSSNYAPVVSGDGKTLAFMNELPFYDAVYISRKDENGNWADASNITPEIQSDGDQYIASLSYDGNTIFLAREGLYDSDIYQSEFNGEAWGVSEPLNKNINTKYWESHATISTDGKTLYFTSNRKESLGEMDIFIATRDNHGDWGEPVNLGETINTPLNEDFPFITADNKRLFFCSQGHDGMGGYDIYYAIRDSNEAWSKPINIGYPINTTDDDMFYCPMENGKKGVKSFIKDDGYGKEDVYVIEILPKGVNAEPITKKKEEKPSHNTLTTTDTIKVSETNTDTIKDRVEEKVLQMKENQPVQEAKTPVTEEQPKTKPEEKVQASSQTAKAIKLEVNNVYFRFNSFAVSHQSEEELKELCRVLKQHQGVTVKLNGYTDSYGDANYNLTLSRNRANAVKSIMVKLGVNSNRIKVEGFGEENPLASNDLIETRKLNRRVEIILTGTDEANIVIK